MSSEKDDAKGTEEVVFMVLFAISVLLLLLSGLRMSQNLRNFAWHSPLIVLYALFCVFSSLRSVYFADIWLHYGYYLYLTLQFAPTTLQFSAEMVLCFIWSYSHRHQVSMEITSQLTETETKWSLWRRYVWLAGVNGGVYVLIAVVEVVSNARTLHISLLAYDVLQCSVTSGLIIYTGRELKRNVCLAFPNSKTTRITVIQAVLSTIPGLNCIYDVLCIARETGGVGGYDQGLRYRLCRAGVTVAWYVLFELVPLTLLLVIIRIQSPGKSPVSKTISKESSLALSHMGSILLTENTS